MTRPGPNVTSDADTQPGSDSLFPTGFSGGGALVRQGSVGTGEIADGSVASADLNLSSVATALAARSEFTGTYASRLRRRDLVLGAMPAPMASPPTMTLGTAGAASTITSAVQVRPEDRSAFRYLGIEPAYGVGFPQDLYYQAGLTYSKSTAPPWAVEFQIDSVLGKFEVATTGSGGAIRLWVDGQLATAAASLATTADGNTYKWAVDFGAAKTALIRLELTGNARFGGIYIGPADGVTAGPKRPRCIVIGDSFTEPTIVDSGTYFAGMGWTQVLGYLTGWDVWACGSGSTGYLNPATGGKVKMRDRLATDVLAWSPDAVIFAMGLNDRAYAGVTYATLNAEVATAITQVKAAASPPFLAVLSQFWPGGPQTQAANLLNQRNAIKDAATAAGVPFGDLLQSTAPLSASGTLAASASIGASTVSSSVAIPARSDGSRNYWVQIGTDDSAETRLVTGQSGTGPYTLTLASPTLANAHAAGDAVLVVGPSAITGTGKQGTTTGNGNADRYTGSDGTHPTSPGHVFLGKRVVQILTSALPTG